MISELDIRNSIESIYDNDNLLDTLLEFEEILDTMHVYAYQNWYDGEVISGPDITRYWIEVQLMYPGNKMPDPDGALRLLKHGAYVYYKKDQIELNVPIENPEDLEMDDRGIKRPKTKNVDVWILKIIVPRSFVDSFNSEKIKINGKEISMSDVTSAWDENLDEIVQKDENDEQE